GRRQGPHPRQDVARPGRQAHRVRPPGPGPGRLHLPQPGPGPRRRQEAHPTGFDGLDLVPPDFTYRNLDLVLDAAKKPTQRIARLLGPLAGDYDLAILDCPPGISLVTENVVHAAGTLLVPLIPTTLSVRALEQLGECGGERGRPP